MHICNLSKVRSIAWTEYRQFVLTKTFLFLVLLSPLLIIVFFAISVIAGSSRDLADRSFLVVDKTGQVTEALMEEARRHNQYEIYRRGEQGPALQVEARFHPVAVDVGTYESERELQLELSEKVRGGEYSGFLIIEADALEGEKEGAVRYFSENQTYQSLPNWLDETLNSIFQNLKLTREGFDPREIRELTARQELERYGLVGVDPGGEIKAAERENPLVLYLVPLGALMILFLCANMSSPIMLNSVMEEKMQRIIEVLLAAVTPFELMLGKLIGSLMVSLTLGFVYLAPAIGFLLWRGHGEAIPPELFFWFPVFLILTLVSLGSVWAAIGASCAELKDTQNFAGIAIFLLVAPMLFSLVILESPHTPFASVMSIIPVFYPFLMVIRILAAPGPEAWEIWVGLLFSVLFTLFTVWAGARIFRQGILSQGKTPGIRGMLGWLREKERDMPTGSNAKD